MQNFEQRLTGGHPNSLGNTIEVVEEVLAKPSRFDELFNCYFSKDEIVRLRVSNAMKRITKANKPLIVPYIDRLINKISKINQASTQWTLSSLFLMLEKDLNATQKASAQAIMEHNLATHNDWIVLNTTMETLGKWAKMDEELKKFILPHLKRHAKDERNSVNKRANKLLEALS
ncbi:MAG: hypothetical protein AAF391_04530 [Bacteroidota bacterium]